MKFYTSIGPNPRVVHIFMAEKGVELPTVQVDIMGGENRQAEHLARNPAGQMPTPIGGTEGIHQERMHY